jgi:gluconate transporter
MLLPVLLIAIVLLIVLITVFKFNAFIALILVSLLAGLSAQMPPVEVIKAVQKGMGDTLGSLTLIIAFGALLAIILSDTGAIKRISQGLIDAFGVRYLNWAMALTGFVVGIVMFYNAGFILLLPLVFSIARRTGISLIQVGLPVAAALSVTHGFLPPHPAPSGIASLFGANVGLVIIYGIIVAIPAIILAGIALPRFLKGMDIKPSDKLFPEKTDEQDAPLPNFWPSLIAAIAPVVLMAVATIGDLVLAKESMIRQVLSFVGDPGLALFIGVFVAILLLGQYKNFAATMQKTGTAIESVASILLIVSAGGAFKQVLIDSGIGEQLTALMQGVSLSPLILGWLIATLIRVSLGSATVAGLTAAGIVQPLLASGSASPELMVLAIGAGSLMLSHVNDTGFWMFKEYFGLSVGQTFRTWTVMESIVGVVGLIGVLLLSLFV